MSNTIDVQEWLESQCNRYKNGYCGNRTCLQNGGYRHGYGEVDYDIATCAAHEALKKLSKLEAEVDGFIHGSL